MLSSVQHEKSCINSGPYLTGMRRDHDWFADRFAKQLRTVVKHSHGIAKSLHELRIGLDIKHFL